MATYMGLAVPLVGDSDIVGNVTVTGTFSASGAQTIGGALALTGTLSVTGAQTLTGATSFGGAISMASNIAKMVIGSVALASLASGASATVALTGITTKSAVLGMNVGAVTDPMPSLWPAATNQLGYSATGGVTLAARTINVWQFATA